MEGTRREFIKKSAVGIGSLLLLINEAACAVKQYGLAAMERFPEMGIFKDKYWNYHDAGVRYQEAGDIENAIHGFEEAIARNPKDCLKAQTYGTNFIEYMPNYHLGEICHALGKDDAARKYLMKSLSTAPTDKARSLLSAINEPVNAR